MTKPVLSHQIGVARQRENTLIEIKIRSFVAGLIGRRVMDSDTQAQAPGQFVKLKSGKVHYQWHGPEDGPVLVLVHGLTTPSFVWGEILPALTAAGMRVLTYDLFGRGYSDRPFAQHNPDFFVRQLQQLLDVLGLDQPINLLGYSMGGGIVSCFSEQNPDSVKRLALLAPVGFHVDLGRFFKVMNIPLLGDILMQLGGGRAIRKDAQASISRENAPLSIVERQILETRYMGYLRSVLSSIRQFPMADLRVTHHKLARLKLPMLAIWGEKDGVIPIAGAAELQEIHSAVQTIVVPDAGHCLAYTHPLEVAASVQAFLQNTDEE